MASRPEELYRDAPGSPGAFLSSLEIAQRYQPVRQYRIAAVPDAREWETGLLSELRIKLQPDHRDQIPAGLVNVVESIKRIERFAANWDSYQGHPLDISTERPAMELVIHGSKRSRYPVVYALPTGGLSLRWTSENAALEIDVSPAGTCEALLELHEQDAELELPRGSSLAEARTLLDQFNDAS